MAAARRFDLAEADGGLALRASRGGSLLDVSREGVNHAARGCISRMSSSVSLDIRGPRGPAGAVEGSV